MNLIPAYPEIFLLIATMAILMVDLFLPAAKRNITYMLSLAALAGCAALSLYSFEAGTVTYTFNNMFVSDPMSHLLKLFSYLAIAVTLVYSRQYIVSRGMASTATLGGEFYALALFSLLGQMVMISGTSFLSIYLGLEMMSLSLYALVALRRDHAVSTEAAMKYFILGAMASGFLLYGMSMLYGATGSLDVNVVAKFAAEPEKSLVLVFGIVFVVAGLAFKLGVVPFHMWVPDVYQGSPTPVTLLLGAAPKLATFAICMRLLVEALLPLAFDWQQMLTLLAVLSLALGNITAIVQTNFKRMLAYSTISHMGFVLLGLASGVAGQDSSGAVDAYSAAMFYAITYVLTTLGTFGVVLLLARAGFEADRLEDLKGLNQRSPWFALVMLILMFSLAGVPPMVGFYAKLAILEAVLSNGQVWLAIVAVAFSLVGAFYYLRVIKLMYFDAPTDTAPIVASGDMRATLSLNGIAIVALGILPGGLMAACQSAVGQSIGHALKNIAGIAA